MRGGKSATKRTTASIETWAISAMTLSHLLDCLASAREPSPELDARIEALGGLPDFHLPDLAPGWAWAIEVNDKDNRKVALVLRGPENARKVHKIYSPPAYTSSLDTALTLVPEGWRTLWAEDLRSISQWDWALCPTDEDSDTEHAEARAPTPALALCIAALKARGLASAREK